MLLSLYMIEKNFDYLGRKMLVMLIEDDISAINLIKHASDLSGYKNDFLEFKDINESLRYLKREGEYINSSLPDLIIQDLYLSDNNVGLEFLKEIKSNEGIKHIPVIVFTESDNPHDINQSYNNYANSYITKPDEFDDLIKVMKEINNFWFNTIQLPKH